MRFEVSVQQKIELAYAAVRWNLTVGGPKEKMAET